MKEYTYIIPGIIPPSMNKYKGRNAQWAYRKDKKNWDTIVWAALQNGEKPPVPLRRAILELCYFFTDNRKRDPNNYSGHFLTDPLQKYKIIEDDSFQCIRLVLMAKFKTAETGVQIRVISLEGDFDEFSEY